MDSLFFQLRELEQADSTMTALQREMLRMTLEANPGVTLGAAVQDVFDYLQVKIKPKRLEAVCMRLIRDNQKRQEQEQEQRPADDGRPQKRSSFGQDLIKWIEGLHASDRLLAAVGFNAPLARQIYCEQDYLVTDTICTLYLQERWNDSLVQLQAAAAPWMGNGKGSAGGEVEYIDLSQASDDDPRWQELGKLFGPC